ncbi:MAG: NAD-dependent epimerase/dehydratase family protein [Chitinophagaceae bacterium]|nr:NAD-dependent epimerase/dehydratase family protein [Chitinophagaceae bacterium]
MKILITGGSGFLGKYIHDFCKRSHEVIAIGRHKGDQIMVDLLNPIPDLPPVDMVIHVAGQAHLVPKTEDETKRFYDLNVTGTSNLLQALGRNETLPNTFVFISTVAVYGCEEGHLIDENFPLSGQSPYADSKRKAEVIIQEWGTSHQVNIVILRLPLVVGYNAPGNLGAMIRAIQKGYYFRMGSGQARRSMVLAEDVARLMPDLYGKKGIYNLSDGEHPSYREIEDAIAHHFKKKIKSLPKIIVTLFAYIGDVLPFFPINTYRLKKLQASLTFSDRKARETLNWHPRRILTTPFLSDIS